VSLRSGPPTRQRSAVTTRKRAGADWLPHRPQSGALNPGCDAGDFFRDGAMARRGDGNAETLKT
jgi:hypothetical protein